MSPTARSGGPTLPVTLVMRQPVPGWHSIETVVEAVVAALPPDVAPEVHVVPHRSVGLRGRLGNLRDTWGLRRRPGVFHVTGDIHYLVLALPRRRTVLTVHDLGTLRTGGRVRRAVIALLWFHLPVRWVARTTTVSGATRHDLVRLIPSRADAVTVVPNPLPPVPAPRPSRPVSERPVILAVGTTPNKNLLRLADAVAPLAVDLVIVGAVPQDVRDRLAPGRPGVRARLREQPSVPRDRLMDLYAAADVLALVATSEGFGLPVIEAQALGVPVVASRIPALVEVAGGAAHLVDPMDPADIRTGLEQVLADVALRDRLIAAGAANVRRFDPETVAASYAAVYRAVAGLTAGDA